MMRGRCTVTIDGIEFASAEPAILRFGGEAKARNYNEARLRVGLAVAPKDAATIRRRAKNKAARKARRRNR
jgi:hypothetical protein